MPFVFIIVMGVSGTGKSTLGQALASSLSLEFIDGDSLHPLANIEKMSAGHPLTDADRLPWLNQIRAAAELRCSSSSSSCCCLSTSKPVHDTNLQTKTLTPCKKPSKGLVVACSALKKSYRDILRGSASSSSSSTRQDGLTDHCPIRTYFVCLHGPRDVLVERMARRTGHFMKPTMVDSQLAVFESPAAEPDVVMVPIEASPQEQLQLALDGLVALLNQ